MLRAGHGNTEETVIRAHVDSDPGRLVAAIITQKGNMNFLHYEVDAADGDVIEVTLDRQANVRVMDGSNFSSFRSGRHHRYIGGLAKRSPVRLAPPHAGHWHVVVDLGGYAGSVRAGVRILQNL